MIRSDSCRPILDTFRLVQIVSAAAIHAHGAATKVRTATAPKSIRLGMSDGTIVAVGFLSKGKTKSSVAVQHEKLPDRETADRLKQFLAERLDALGKVLAEA